MSATIEVRERCTNTLPRGTERGRLPMRSKRCTRCALDKPLSDFSPDRRATDGVVSICRVCHAAYQGELRRAGRLAPRQRKQEWNRGWYQRWSAANPEKVKAHNAVQRALKSGKLVRPDACSACGSAKRIVAHHDDYTRVLDVRWLCVLCHNAHHGNEKVAP